jgi:hypothetical protein
VDFWKDSLIEFCWLKTKNKPLVDMPATSGKSLLEQLLDDANNFRRLPKTMSTNPADYDTQMLNAIWSKLTPEQREFILSSLPQ